MEPINKNTFKEWIECKSRVEERLLKGLYKSSDVIKFHVVITENNVENLIFFFPIADMARIFGCKTELEITVKGKTQEKNRLISKAKQFLFLQQSFRKSVLITVNNSDVPLQTRFGNLQPIIAVTAHERSQFQYQRVGIEGINNQEGLRTLLKMIIKTTVMNENLTVDDLQEVQKVLDNTPELYTEEFDKNNVDSFNTLNSKDIQWGSLFFISTSDDMSIVYSKMIYSNFARIIEILKNKKEYGSRVANQIIDCFFKNTATLPLLTEYICALIIRYLFESNAIQNTDNSDDSAFYLSLFDISLNHAEAISDGLRQIIENACLYSKSKSAYFYLRIHSTEIDSKSDTKTKYEKAQNSAKTLISLSEEYDGYKLNSSNKFYLEVCFVDNAFDQDGITGMKEHFETTRNTTVAGLKDIFRYAPKDNNDLIIHYGLRVFERTIRMNHGAFLVRTPSGEEGKEGYTYNSLVNKIEKNTSQYKIERSDDIEEPEYYTGTIYKAIIPISDSLGQDKAIVTQDPIDLFETSSIHEKYIPYLINIEIKKEDRLNRKKTDMVKYLFEQINNRLEPIAGQANRIICLRPAGFGVLEMELLAKSLVKYQLENKDQKYRIALLLDEKNQIIEFTRIYAAFCDISGKSYERFCLKDSQIALCKYFEYSDDTKLPCVCYVLCGNDLVSAQRSVRNYLYYNSDITMEFLPIIRYMTGFYDERKTVNTSPVEINAKPIFPFDLFLDIDDFNSYNNQNSNLEEEKIWFLRYIDYNLNCDMQSTPNGCCIENVHVSIGSKIHVDRYYNAEFLFHNYANVFRFAYLIAGDILKDYLSLCNSSGIPIRRKNIVMVAYGEYSLILIQKICDILEKECAIIEQVDYILFPSYLREEEQREWQAQGKEIREFLIRKGIKEKDNLEEYIFYPVIPLSTTLSTVQRIHDFIIRICKTEGLKSKLVFGLNSSLIVVGKYDENKVISKSYWERFDEEKKTIFIKSIDPTALSEQQRRVRYFFNPNGKWYKASEIKEDDSIQGKCGCEICNADDSNKVNRRCLIGVDKTSTLPDVIFDSLTRKKKLFDLHCVSKSTADSEEINMQRIHRLYRKLRYSHITYDKNHFQYDIDYESYCRDEKNISEIRKWLKSVVRSSIDNDAFNIIVSPLSASNSSFLKNVIEYAFDNNGRIVNIKFNSSFRDEIRTKYEYITDEYRSLCSNISGAKVNVYFVDNCIVEGTTFQRSRQLMYMLLSGSGMDMSCVSLFEGIILLSNRSSYDTIQNLLHDNIDKRFYYYLRLNVPSFNAKNSICPACQLADKYHLMWKRASTPTIANEYQRLKEKLSPKTTLEYDKWLNRILDFSDIPDWFMSWLYYSVEYSDYGKFRYLDITGEVNDLLGKNGCLRSLTEDEVKRIFRSGRKELFKIFDSCDQERKDRILLEIKNVYREIIRPGRDYARMLCTHNVFKVYEEVHTDAVNNRIGAYDYEQNLRKEILIHIKEELVNIEKKASENKVKQKGILWLKFEWLISYIKILSRKQPAAYYQLRNTVYILLSEILDGMIKSEYKEDLSFILQLCNPHEAKNYNVSFMPDLKFTFFLTVIRRLAALYSSYIINNLPDIFDYFNRCRNQYDASKEYSSFYNNSSADYIHYTNMVSFPERKQFGFDIAKLIKWSSVYGVDDSKCHMVERILASEIKNIGTAQIDDERMSAYKLAFLENTQVIYRGFKKLRIYWYDLLSDDAFNRVHDSFSEMLKKLRDSNDNKNEAVSLRPLVDFMDFQEKIDNGEMHDLCYKLTSMLMLFYRLCNLEVLKKPITNPYDYVHVCNYIRNITECSKCRIIGVKEHHITTIASSDENQDYLIYGDISDETIDTVVQAYMELIHSNSHTLVDRAVTKYSFDNYSDLYLIPVLIEDSHRSVNFDPDYYLIIYRGNSFNNNPKQIPLTYDDLWNIRNVLFLRNRFEIVLSRDMSYLRDMISSYGYIKPLNDDKKPRVLHISDLHIKADEKDDSERSRLIDDDIKTAIETWELDISENKPDLLLITGDVITGDYKASILKRSYEKAENTIKHIVKKIWTEKSKHGEDYVRSDWKKRILISTGNHDYASMNELEAHNLLRITTSGTPGALGDTMIKYSYFVNFIHNLLGTEIDEIVRYDINHIINYEKLGISVVNLNSNSDVNPLRTNKVRISADDVRKMKSHNSLRTNLIYMMHHTPMYDINYLSDVYYLHYTIESEVWKEIKNIGCVFSPGSSVSSNDVWLKLIHSLAHDFSEDVYGLSDEKQKMLIKNILRIIEDRRKNEYIERKLDDFLYYINCKDPISDDKCRHIKYYLIEREYATQQDSSQYVEFAVKHFGSLDKERRWFTILGGHTHEAAISDVNLHKTMANCLGIYEAGRFIERNESRNITLNYFLFAVDNSAGNGSSPVGNTMISQSPKKPKKKKISDCETLKKIIDRIT